MSVGIPIGAGKPGVHGLYVAYVNDEQLPNYAKRAFLMWHDGRWSYPGSDQFYRGHVYQWVGPFPALKLED